MRLATALAAHPRHVLLFAATAGLLLAPLGPTATLAAAAAAATAVLAARAAAPDPHAPTAERGPESPPAEPVLHRRGHVAAPAYRGAPFGASLLIAIAAAVAVLIGALAA